MPRRVKDFIDISEYTSLDDLIRYLKTIRDNMPPDHQAELKIRGDDIFGRRLTISYFREQTAEEVQLESKYAGGDAEGELLAAVSELPAPGIVVKVLTRTAPSLHELYGRGWAVIQKRLWSCDCPALRRY